MNHGITYNTSTVVARKETPTLKVTMIQLLNMCIS